MDDITGQAGIWKWSYSRGINHLTLYRADPKTGLPIQITASLKNGRWVPQMGDGNYYAMKGGQYNYTQSDIAEILSQNAHHLQDITAKISGHSEPSATVAAPSPPPPPAVEARPAEPKTPPPSADVGDSAWKVVGRKDDRVELQHGDDHVYGRMKGDRFDAEMVRHGNTALLDRYTKSGSVAQFLKEHDAGFQQAVGASASQPPKPQPAAPAVVAPPAKPQAPPQPAAQSPAAASSADGFRHGAGYAVVDAKGNLIAGENHDAVLHPASTTKVATVYETLAAVRAGKVHMDDKIDISSWPRSDFSRKIQKISGGQITVEEAIKLSMVKSHNEAAKSLGEYVASRVLHNASTGGTEAEFARMITDRAHALGAAKTNFVNASGLPHPDHVSTPLDLTKIAGAVVRDFPQEHQQYFGLNGFSFRGMPVKGHCKLNGQQAGVGSVDFGKTGFTNASGFTLVSSAVDPKTGERIFGSVIGAPNPNTRDAAMKLLLSRHLHKEGQPANAAAPPAPQPAPSQAAAPSVQQHHDEPQAAASNPPQGNSYQEAAARMRQMKAPRHFGLAANTGRGLNFESSELGPAEQALVNHIKNAERGNNYTPGVYQDTGGKGAPALGYGQRTGIPEALAAAKKAGVPLEASKEKADIMLRFELARHWGEARKIIGPDVADKLPSDVAASAAELAYNAGADAIKGTKYLKAIQEGRYADAKVEFLDFNHMHKPSGEKVVAKVLDGRRKTFVANHWKSHENTGGPTEVAAAQPAAAPKPAEAAKPPATDPAKPPPAAPTPDAGRALAFAPAEQPKPAPQGSATRAIADHAKPAKPAHPAAASRQAHHLASPRRTAHRIHYNAGRQQHYAHDHHFDHHVQAHHAHRGQAHHYQAEAWYGGRHRGHHDAHGRNSHHPHGRRNYHHYAWHNEPHAGHSHGGGQARYAHKGHQRGLKDAHYAEAYAHHYGPT